MEPERRRTKPLIHEGAIAAGTPAEAELGSDAVISMLQDDAAYEEVLFGVHRLIDELSQGALHIVCGAISIAQREAHRGARPYPARGIFARDHDSRPDLCRSWPVDD